MPTAATHDRLIIGRDERPHSPPLSFSSSWPTATAQPSPVVSNVSFIEPEVGRGRGRHRRRTCVPGTLFTPALLPPISVFDYRL